MPNETFWPIFSFLYSYDTLNESEKQTREYFENKKGIYHKTFLHK